MVVSRWGDLGEADVAVDQATTHRRVGARVMDVDDGIERPRQGVCDLGEIALVAGTGVEEMLT
jgi:hypothetical protein